MAAAAYGNNRWTNLPVQSQIRETMFDHNNAFDSLLHDRKTMLIKFYCSDGQQLGDYPMPPGFSYSMGGPHRMPNDAPEAARKYKMFNIVEDLGGEEIGDMFVPAFKAVVIEH
jgi:hypothetical protein